MGITVTLMKGPNMATDIKRVPISEQHKALKIAFIIRCVLVTPVFLEHFDLNHI